MKIPLALVEAIERGACVPLQSRNGFLVVTEATPCPSCHEMRAFYVLKQTVTATESTWSSLCVSNCAEVSE
jgi:hypothetical protein